MNLYKESEMFNQVAEYYDKYRPGYPEEIIDSLISVTGISNGSDLLEIGCGSGKATAQFVGNGFNILGIDPGEDLVRIGNERFKNENINFVQGRFEEHDFVQKKFDVIYAIGLLFSAAYNGFCGANNPRFVQSQPNFLQQSS